MFLCLSPIPYSKNDHFTLKYLIIFKWHILYKIHIKNQSSQNITKIYNFLALQLNLQFLTIKIQKFNNISN